MLRHRPDILRHAVAAGLRLRPVIKIVEVGPSRPVAQILAADAPEGSGKIAVG